MLRERDKTKRKTEADEIEGRPETQVEDSFLEVQKYNWSTMNNRI